jgi:hypothetical protein
MITARILLPALAILLPLTAQAGPDQEAAKPQPGVGRNPLSFLDGAVVFDVEERFRFEGYHNSRDFDDSVNDDQDDTWALNRFRLGVAINPARWLKVYGQMQDTREWNSDRVNTPGVRGTQGEDNFDLRQAYVELADYSAFPLGLIVGRQLVEYGDRRLIADSKWNMLGRTFDAVRLRLQFTKFWAEAFAMRPVQIKEEVFNDSDAADNVFGIYTSNAYVPWQDTDLYWIYRDKGDEQPDLDPTQKLDPRGSWNGPAQRIHTVGTRWKSKPKELDGWDYTFETAYQWGEVWATNRETKESDHRAWALHASGGYTFEQAAWKPRIGVEYNYATGDQDPTDSESQSFQNLFPSNHEKYGYFDEFSWRNLHDARVQLNVRPVKNVDLELNYHAFWLAETTDYWFRSNGISTLRTTTPDGRDVRTIGVDNFAGHEIDFVVKWKATKWLAIDVGYSHFFPGEYLRQTGPSDGADFAYAQAVLTF